MSEHMPDPVEMTAASAKENTQIEASAPAEEKNTAAAPQAETSAKTQPEEAPGEERAPEIPETASKPETSAAEIPLAWHRFLSRFYLWIAAAYHFAQAALVLTGLIYRGAAARDAVYAGLPGMQYLDWTFAALLAMGGLAQVIAAVRLGKMKKIGPVMLRASYVLLLLGQVIYGAGRYTISSLTPFTGSIVSLTAVYIAMLLVNAGYYKKRKEIFNP